MTALLRRFREKIALSQIGAPRNHGKIRFDMQAAHGFTAQRQHMIDVMLYSGLPTTKVGEVVDFLDDESVCPWRHGALLQFRSRLGSGVDGLAIARSAPSTLIAERLPVPFAPRLQSHPLLVLVAGLPLPRIRQKLLSISRLPALNPQSVTQLAA